MYGLNISVDFKRYKSLSSMKYWDILSVPHVICKCETPAFNPIRPGGGADLPQPSRIRVYAGVYAYTGANFF